MTVDSFDSDETGDSTRTGAAIASTHVLELDGATVEVVEGPGKGASCRMEAASLAVGSGAGVDLRIPDRTLSRRHFELAASRDGLLLRDLGSRNGTFVMGCRVSEGIITSATTITAGNTRVTVRPTKSALPLEVTKATQFGDAVGQSVAMRHVFALLSKVAGSNATILLEGESGTGKEVLAHAVHSCSGRGDGPFVVLDCASLPENLVESELFGHERGSFTGAIATHVGAFEQAQGGTLFLDEIGELPSSQQPKLLRALETRAIRRVGGREILPVDVRVIAATHVDMVDAVHRKAFREDLFYRLSVVRVTVPPLRDRKDDLPLLARRLYERFTGSGGDVAPDVLQIFQGHSWPGNVRELRNAIERWVALGTSAPEQLLGAAGAGRLLPALSDLPYHQAKRRALEAFDREYFPAVLAKADGVISRAAQLADVPRPSFHRMLGRSRGE